MAKKTKRILVTGSAGRLGSIVASELLEGGHQVRGFDVNASASSLKDSVVANLTDRDAVARAVEGMDTVIHLGATPDNQDFLTLILPNNLEGLYNVVEASRAAGVKRLILASSMQVVDRSIEPGHTIKLGDPYTPNNPYACAKVFAEMLGQMYAANHPMIIMSVRIGWSPRDLAGAQKLARSKKGVISYLSHRDAARFFPSNRRKRKSSLLFGGVRGLQKSDHSRL
jgi:uronate dehydrogenase